MKYIKYFATMCIAIFIVSCTEDLGNYTYIELNDVTIDKINDGKTFSRTPGEAINIEGKFSRKLNPSTDGLSYIWTIGKDTVSTSRNLEYTIPDGSAYGVNNCRFIVVDENGMQYSDEFRLSIRCPYGFGYYILCKEPNNTSRIYFLPSNNDDAGFDNEEKVISTGSIGEYILGPSPSNIAGKFDYIESLDTEVWILYFATSGNDNNIITTTSAQMLPDRIYNSSSFFDGISRELKSPRTYFDDYGYAYVLADGKIMSTVEQYIYRPAKDSQNYHWTNSLPNVDGSVTIALDKLSSKLAILTPEVNDPLAGTTTDKYALDKVRFVKDCPSYKDRSIIDIRVKLDASKVNYIFYVTSASDEGISIDKVTFHTKEFTTEFANDVLITHDNSSNEIKGVAVGDDVIDWYFVIDNVLYSSPNIQHELTEVVDLPTNLGEVREIKASAKLDHVMISMYNSSTGKGSLVRVWLQDGEIDLFENVMSEPISLFSADGNPWW